MTEKTEAGQLVAVWKEDTGEGKDQTVLQLYRLPGGELVMHDRAHVLLMANEEAVNRYVEAWMEGTHAIPEYVRRVDAMDGNEPREIQLWETESEALYLVPVLNGIPMSKQAVVRYAWKGGLFARDAAEVSIGESACTTEADGRIVATWYPGGRIDIELRPGDLKLGTLRYLGFTPAAQVVGIAQAGNARAVRRGTWQAERQARELALDDFHKFWTRTGENYTTGEHTGFYANFPMDDRSRGEMLTRTAWLVAQGFLP